MFQSRLIAFKFLQLHERQRIEAIARVLAIRVYNRDGKSEAIVAKAEVHFIAHDVWLANSDAPIIESVKPRHAELPLERR